MTLNIFYRKIQKSVIITYFLEIFTHHFIILYTVLMNREQILWMDWQIIEFQLTRLRYVTLRTVNDLYLIWFKLCSFPTYFMRHYIDVLAFGISINLKMSHVTIWYIIFNCKVIRNYRLMVHKKLLVIEWILFTYLSCDCMTVGCFIGCF